MDVFSSQAITIAFVAMFASTGVLALSDKLNLRWLELAGLLLGLATSLYCAAAAVYLWSDWQDPIASANIAAEDVGSAAARGRGRGAIVIVAIQYWPYILGGLAAYFFYNHFCMFRYYIRAARRARLDRAIEAEVSRLQSAHDSLGETLEESATMMDDLAEDFSDQNPEIARRLKEIAKDARE